MYLGPSNPNYRVSMNQFSNVNNINLSNKKLKNWAQIFWKKKVLNCLTLSQIHRWWNFKEYKLQKKWFSKKCSWRFLLPRVNFINVKRANFSYEHLFDSFFSSYMYIVKAAKTTFIQKICTFNFDEIVSWMNNMICFKHFWECTFMQWLMNWNVNP